MKYTIELTDTEYNILTGFMNMISSEIKAEYFQNAELEPVKIMRIEDTTEYQMGYKAGREDGYACCRENTDLVYELKQAEYNKGLEEAWKFAKKIALNEDDGGYPVDTLSEIFDATFYDTLANNTIYEVEEKIKAYEEKKRAEEESVKVGDIIYSDSLKLNAIITHDDGMLWRCIDTDGIGFIKLKDRLDEEWEKVGHTDDLAVLLAKVGGKE